MMASDYEIEESTDFEDIPDFPEEDENEEVNENNSYDVFQAIGQQNITNFFTDRELEDIAQKCAMEYDIDEGNFQSRKQRIQELYKLALQVIEEKNYPFDNASNIKFPILTKAALNFAAIAYPAIVQDDQVVKGKVIGNDDGDEIIKDASGEPLIDPDTGKPTKKNAGLKKKVADRIGQFMSNQILEDMDGWEDDMDKILHIIPIIGCAFKKIYHDPILKKNISKLVLPQYLVVNIDAQSLNSSQRTSELVPLYPYEIQEYINAGIFKDFDYAQSTQTLDDNYRKSTDEGGSGAQDADKPHLFIEQHRRLDLDGDGYPEPYVVWIHKETNELVRILPRFEEMDIEQGADGGILRIEHQQYYTKYPFIPDPEGSIYDIGFGHLVQHLNVAINTSINQMLDQGHMYTLGGGFIGDGLKMKSGNIKFKPNEWKRVKSSGMSVRENVVPLPTREPSNVLMVLLEFLIRSSEEMVSLSRMMAGDIPPNMAAVTAMASLEQGLQPFKAIFKRIHRASKLEYKRLFYLNQLYLTQEEYSNVLDDQSANVEQDFMSGRADVIPVSDPEIVTNIQSMMRAQVLMDLKDDPLLDGVEIRKRALIAMNIPDVEGLVKLPPEQGDPVGEAQVAALQAQIKDLDSQMTTRMLEQERKDKEFMLKVNKAEFEVEKMQAETIRTLADADSKEKDKSLAVYQTYANHLSQLKKELGDGRREEGRISNPTGMGDMEAAPINN